MTVINSMALKVGQGFYNLETVGLNNDPIAIKVVGANNGVILHFDCATTTTLNFKGADTVFGGDMSVTVPGGNGYCSLDIGAVIQKSGEYKDHIILQADTNDCMVGLIELI